MKRYLPLFLVAILLGNMLMVAPAFVVGFSILIPWYRKFAKEEEYWGFYTKKTSRMSPVFIMMCITALLFLIA